VVIEITNTHTTNTINEKAVRRLLRTMASHETALPVKFLSVVYVNNSDIRKINRQYLKHNYATDVISFNWSDGKTLEGEIYVSLDKAASQAKEFGVTYAEEVQRLTAHGFLHIAGYDDRTSRQQKHMLELGDHYIAMTHKKRT
jgi:probable rRNA maturation factor